MPRKGIQIFDEMSLRERLTLCASEICGTAILVFLGCMGCVSGVVPDIVTETGATLRGVIPHEQISFTFGLAVMVAVQVFGHVSGSHINPIVTLAAATLGNIPLIQVPIYFLGQFLGAILGYACLMAVTPEQYLDTNPVGVCSPSVNPKITPIQGCFVEFLISLILVLVCCGVWDSRNSDKHDSVPIKFGLTIAVLAMAGGPYTGGNMNPARSFAPALFNWDWTNHWVYWVGPLAAGFLGALLYRLLFTKEPPVSKETFPEEVALNDKA